MSEPPGRGPGETAPRRQVATTKKIGRPLVAGRHHAGPAQFIAPLTVTLQGGQLAAPLQLARVERFSSVAYTPSLDELSASDRTDSTAQWQPEHGRGVA